MTLIGVEEICRSLEAPRAQRRCELEQWEQQLQDVPVEGLCLEICLLEV